MNPQPETYTTAQAAARAGLTSAAIRDLIDAGHFPGAKKIRGHWRIPHADLETWLQNRPPSPPPDAPTRWQRFKSRPLIFWSSLILSALSALSLFLFALISAGADLGGARQQAIELGLIRPFQKASEGEILIVIANFDTGDTDRKSGIQSELRTAIENQRRLLNLLDDVRVEIDPTVIPAGDRDLAAEIGRDHGATTIIWGSDTEFRIQANFLDLTAPSLTPLEDTSIVPDERLTYLKPDPYINFVSEKLSPQLSFLALYAIGNAYLKNGTYILAEPIFRHALENYANALESQLQNRLHELWFRVASANQALGNLPQAIADYGQAIALNPQWAAAYTNRGIAYYDLGDLAQAITDYDQAIVLDPQLALAYCARGNAYHDLGDLEQALADYDQAIALNPKFAEAYSNRGATYHDLGDLEQALADHDQAIALNSQFAAAYNNRGITYHDLGDLEQALADYDQAIALNPQLAQAYYNRGLAYYALSDLVQAIASSDQAIALDPQHANAHINRGNAFYALGNFEKAIADYDQAIALDAIALDPKNVGVYINRGNAFYALGNFEQAVADYDQAIALDVIALDPKYVGVYINRGNAYEKLGDLAQAITDYDQAIVLDPQYSLAYNRRGNAYEKMGNLAQAIADFQRYLELAPNAPDRAQLETIIQDLQQQLNQPN